MKNHLHGIDTIIVRVKNIEYSKQWYTEKLGLICEWEDPALKLSVLRTGGPTSLTLWQTDSSVAGNSEGSCFPIFRTPDAQQAHAEFREAGINTDPIIKDIAVTYFRFFDPDGNVLEACQVHG